MRRRDDERGVVTSSLIGVVTSSLIGVVTSSLLGLVTSSMIGVVTSSEIGERCDGRRADDVGYWVDHGECCRNGGDGFLLTFRGV